MLLGTTYYKFHQSNGQRQQAEQTAGGKRGATWKELLPNSFGRTETTSLHGLVLWSSDFHISPIADIKHIVAGYGVKVIDKSLSGHCQLTGTCERDLKVINVQNGINLHPCPNRLRTAFYDVYRADPEMLTVDAFLCLHATAMCELYMPFNRSLIVVASTRYEIGRHDAASWQQWNDNLRLIASNPFNTIAANNRYDQAYVKYFTGIQDVLLLPNKCGYVTARYRPTRREILIAPARGVNGRLSDQLTTALRAFNSQRAQAQAQAQTQTQSQSQAQSHSQSHSHAQSDTNTSSSPLVLAHIRDLYPHFEYTDLAAHPALIILPYQVSSCHFSFLLSLFVSLFMSLFMSLFDGWKS
jgi:hypothetical protein